MNSANSFDLTSLEEGRSDINDLQTEIQSTKSARTSKSRRPRRRATAASNGARMRANSSFQYPTNMSTFSTGASIHSSGTNAQSPKKSSVQEIPKTYHYEIVPTTFPHPQDSSNSTFATPNPVGGVTDSEDDDNDSHKNFRNSRNNGAQVVVRPKQIQQNPLTPTILPKGFTPINRWGMIKAKYHKEWLAEFLGTLVLVTLGDACSLQNVLTVKANEENFTSLLTSYSSGVSGEQNAAQLLSAIQTITQGYTINVQIGWGGAVLCGYFAAGGSSLSGAHLNMCVTLSNFFFRGSPHWKLVLPYILAQLFGGYVAGLLIFGYYQKVITEVFPDWKTNQQLLSAFVTIPKDYLSSGRQFISEAVATMFLIMGIFAMTDPYSNTSNDLFPLYMFILVYTLMAGMSLQTEAAINFGRDFGPRLALLTLGGNSNVLFDSNHHYFWVPIVGPVVGGLWGAFVYDLFIFRGHESWVNRPVYQNVDTLRRKWYKLRRNIFKHRKSRYKSDSLSDSDDSDDENFMTDSGTDVGSSLHSGGMSANNSELDKDSEHEIEPRGELSNEEVGYDKLSLNGLDTFSLTDIPEEEDLEIENETGKSKRKNSQPNTAINSTNGYSFSRAAAAANNSKSISKKDIHFKSSGKNRRFVPTL
ncbi:hypothetical protein QEN19_003878 [Hanseniaspora menglaensis]